MAKKMVSGVLAKCVCGLLLLAMGGVIGLGICAIVAGAYAPGIQMIVSSAMFGLAAFLVCDGSRIAAETRGWKAEMEAMDSRWHSL